MSGKEGCNIDGGDLSERLGSYQAVLPSSSLLYGGRMEAEEGKGGEHGPGY